jgi:hypothetical protein
MTRFWISAALAVTLAAASLTTSAHANGPVSHAVRPFCAPNFSIDLPGCLFKACKGACGYGGKSWGYPLPTHQAAPWYLYWPYDAHFQTPAPVFAPYTPPPVYPLPYNPYAPGFAYPGAYWSTAGHPVPGQGGSGWPPIPTPNK